MLVGAVGPGSPDVALGSVVGANPCLAIGDCHASDLARSHLQNRLHPGDLGPGVGPCSTRGCGAHCGPTANPFPEGSGSYGAQVMFRGLKAA